MRAWRTNQQRLPEELSTRIAYDVLALEKAWPSQAKGGRLLRDWDIYRH